MTITEELQRLRETAEAALKSSGKTWVAQRPHEDGDGTSQVYATSLGPLRMVVPVAETSPPFSAHIAACSPDRILALVREVELLRAAVVAGEDCSCFYVSGAGHEHACLLRPGRAMGEP